MTYNMSNTKRLERNSAFQADPNYTKAKAFARRDLAERKATYELAKAKAVSLMSIGQRTRDSRNARTRDENQMVREASRIPMSCPSSESRAQEDEMRIQYFRKN